MRIAIDPTITRLVRDVGAGIRVLQSRDGVDLSESQILERARNIVMGLIGNYRIEALDLTAEARDEARDHESHDHESRGSDRRDGRGRDAEPVSIAFSEPASMMGQG